MILAGGTMQPFADLEQQLFHRLPESVLRTHSYGHIVPPANLLPLALTMTPEGRPLTFTLGTRATPEMMGALVRARAGGRGVQDVCVGGMAGLAVHSAQCVQPAILRRTAYDTQCEECAVIRTVCAHSSPPPPRQGSLLLELCGRVPDGLIVFVPSFQYESELVAHWEARAAHTRVPCPHTHPCPPHSSRCRARSWQANGTWAALGDRKKLFREPREAVDLDTLLAEYAAAIEASYGDAGWNGGAGGGGGGLGASGAAACTKGRVVAARPSPRGALLISVVGGKMSEGKISCVT